MASNRLNGKSVAAEGVGWDAVTLLLVVPALFAVLPSPPATS